MIFWKGANKNLHRKPCCKLYSTYIWREQIVFGGAGHLFLFFPFFFFQFLIKQLNKSRTLSLKGEKVTWTVFLPPHVRSQPKFKKSFFFLLFFKKKKRRETRRINTERYMCVMREGVVEEKKKFSFPWKMYRPGFQVDIMCVRLRLRVLTVIDDG